LFSQFLLYTSLCIILDRLQNAVHDQETNEHGEVMQEVRTYIDKNYAQDISLEYIADHSHLSVYYLARQFRKYTAYTVNKYIVSCRIGEAQRRLIHTDDRIDDIAVICGYTNLSYFYASFKKNVGCTPMEFRNAYKNEAEVFYAKKTLSSVMK
jgi:AraC-like DNA-binding protein